MAFPVHPDRPTTLTPRLRHLLATDPGDKPGAVLAEALLRWTPGRGEAPDLGGTTLDVAPAAVFGQPAAALEVVGGPEDGRVVQLARNQTLGRWSERGGPDVALFAETGAWDAYQSRTHLRWLGDGGVDLLRPARTPGGQVVRGPLVLTEGQVLWLTEGTGVRGVGLRR